MKAVPEPERYNFHLLSLAGLVEDVGESSWSITGLKQTTCKISVVATVKVRCRICFPQHDGLKTESCIFDVFEFICPLNFIIGSSPKFCPCLF